MTLRGISDIEKLLTDIAPRQAVNILRATVHSTATKIAKDAKDAMPSDSGDMKKATRTKREQVKWGKLLSTVRVGPEAFYWRFREYGQGPDGREDAMFMQAVAKFQGDMDRIFTEEFGKKFESALVRARKRIGP